MKGAGRAIIIGILLLPAICGSGEYAEIHQPDCIIENRGGIVHVRQQPEIVGRLSRFISRRRDLQCVSTLDHVQLAEELAATSHPKALAAIGQVESGFDPQARGKAGERGAWQVRPELWGAVPNTVNAQLHQAEEILEQLIRTEGTLTKAIQSYNGNGPKARKYQSTVLKTIKEI